MNKIDASILKGQFPAEPSADEQLPAGTSYYWDCRAEGLNHEQAVRKAARQMGAALSSLQAMQRSAQ